MVDFNEEHYQVQKRCSQAGNLDEFVAKHV